MADKRVEGCLKLLELASAGKFDSRQLVILLETLVELSAAAAGKAVREDTGEEIWVAPSPPSGTKKEIKFRLKPPDSGPAWQIVLLRDDNSPYLREDLLEGIILRFQWLWQREARCQRIAWRGAAWQKLLGVLLLLAERLEVQQVLNYVVQWSARLVGARYVLLRLHDARTDKLSLAAAWGIEVEKVPAEIREAPVEGTVAGKVFQEGKPVIWPPAAELASFFPRFFSEVKSGVIVPVKFKNEVLGTLSIYDVKERTWRKEEIDLLYTFGVCAGLAVRNALLVRQVEKFHRHLLEALSFALDMRNPYTAGHSWRVGVLARKIAVRMGLPRELVDKAYLVGLVHDIGKIAVRDAVLAKPGPLDPAEWEEIKRHPVVGAEILAKVGMDEDTILAVRYHHEDVAGGGYPAGLKGEEIPLLARIIRVADAYDAMTSRRSYRRSLEHEEAVEELRRYAGIQFDPRVVEVFLSLPRASIQEVISSKGGGGYNIPFIEGFGFYGFELRKKVQGVGADNLY
ncbi:metal dependent phosphohydrolase [Ammonifex degensii KC4]|uniref:Metal dependent phosphohydrolase n=1 Tax=Ammonifex degensii (strain DSM 10501 / KC4) TaxID=429009 RepID=C9RBI3_AMMDK|nr:HD-GYP domain-containing protein [Ammonifex degensii]ACX51610.1 metal dependent phosphohydrolase [Ammonifex degensii KC4]